MTHTIRQALQTRCSQGDVLRSLLPFNIHDTLPALQHDFCALWNEVVLEARNEGADKTLTEVLPEIRHLFDALHQGTNTALTVPFTTSIDDLDSTLRQPSSYPLCNAPSHGTDQTAQTPVPGISSSHTCTTQLGNSPSYWPHLTSPEKQRFFATSTDIAAHCAMQGDTDISNTSSNANLVHSAPQQNKETTAVPLAIVPGPL